MQQLVIAGQVLSVPVSTILGNEFVKLIPRYVIHDLGENIASDVHNLAVLPAKLLCHFQIKKSKTALKPLLTKGYIEFKFKILHHLYFDIYNIISPSSLN